MDVSWPDDDGLSQALFDNEASALAAFSSTPARDQEIRLASFESALRRSLGYQSADFEPFVAASIRFLLALTELDRHRAVGVPLLIDCCFYYWQIGRNVTGRTLSERLLRYAEEMQELATQRRLHNMLAVHWQDAADYQAALSHLDTALTLARQLGDPMQAAPCLANSVLVLKDMGHYQDAIRIARIVLDIGIDTASSRLLKFQCATNGLFCAHRLQDASQALYFLELGNGLMAEYDFDPLMNVTYEYYRALYLVDTFDHETAEELIAAAKVKYGGARNPRLKVLLAIPEALCEWAHRDEAGFSSSRQKLRELYALTKKSRLYHDDVLRILMKTYGNAIDQESAKLGMQYAKELVEFTTNVKRAKFYRQLSDRGVDVDRAPPRIDSPFDPFANVRQWLSPASEGKPLDAIHGPNAIKARVQKHEELAAIHEDLAKLRTEAILKEIRSVAYDTAENWALAAEFFDDQTGQHCFRVGHLAGMLARELGLENDYCARIEHAARLHDIGKIGINEMILLKPGPLDPSELTAMRAHAEVGAYMLQGAKDPVLQMAAVIAKHHHEWWNGAGYPSSLGDRSIPLAARICALADVYDALTHARPYKGAWPHRVAVEEMLNLSGVQFDPHMMRPFLRVLERYVPALADGRIPGLDQLRTNGLIASRKKLMETISGSKP